MHVDLAAQVRTKNWSTSICTFPLLSHKHHLQTLSKTVAIGLQQFVGSTASESAEFCEMLNKFFDCLNTRCLGEGWRTSNSS